MAAFTSDNAGILSGKGIPINPGNLYVAHFLGAGGATKFIPGAINNPDAPATAFVSPGAARANRSIFFNRDGSPKTAGEVYAERTGRFVSREPVATPALPAGGAVAGVPSMMSAGAPATMPVSPSRPTGARVPTFLGSQAQGGFDPNALPAAPTAVASAQASPEADMPVAGGQPAQFQIPGQPAPAAAPAAAPVAQGFGGFGGSGTAGTPRISPEQAEILKAAWKNPNTRAMATQVYQALVTGKDSPWKMDSVNGVSSWVNPRTGQIIPVTGVGPHFTNETDADGNQFKVNSLTGERSIVMQATKPRTQIVKAEDGTQYVVDPDDGNASPRKLSLGNAGVRVWGSVGPDGQVVQPPPNAAPNAPGYYDAKGVPQLMTGKGVSVTNQIGAGETEEAKELGKLRGKRAETIEASAMKAPDQIAKLNMLGGVLDNATTGTLGPTETKVVGLAQALGISDDTIKNLGLNPQQAVTAQIATKLTNELVTGMIGSGGFPSNNFSNTDREFLTDIFPKISNRPEANRTAIEILKRVQQRNLEFGDAWSEYQQAQQEAGKPIKVSEFEFNFRKSLRGKPDLFADMRDASVAPAASKSEAAPVSKASPTPKQPDTTLPINIPATMKPEDVKKRYKSGTKIILPDGTEGVVP
ncbi:hypothetical protein MKK51_10195 [Methylobacterium sp. E-045]|nr:hypothetical protein [Methylobacterium sp. E-045]